MVARTWHKTHTCRQWTQCFVSEIYFSSHTLLLSLLSFLSTGLQLSSKSVGISIRGSSPTSLNFLKRLKNRIVLKSMASVSLQLKDSFDNVANAVVSTCTVGLCLFF